MPECSGQIGIDRDCSGLFVIVRNSLGIGTALTRNLRGDCYLEFMIMTHPLMKIDFVFVFVLPQMGEEEDVGM